MRDGPDTGELLAWYDRHARDLPWRTRPAAWQAGERPDPYRVWLSEVMLQQTTVAAVREYFARFTTLWPTVADLAAAEDGQVMAEWAGLGYYARARNLLKCARAVVSDHGGVFPSDRAALLALPGIGPYTASAIAAIAFDAPEVVVDGNVERVMARVFNVHTPLPAAKPELTALAGALTPEARPGDYAQAVMDLGATICTPRSPACGICPWRDPCRARAAGTAAVLPKKTPKVAKPVRHGVAFVGRRADGALLLERRPDKGLLGGTLGWPGTGWVPLADPLPQPAPPLPGDWRPLPAKALHTFTHFHLRLSILVCDSLPLGDGATIRAAALRPGEAGFVRREDFTPSDMPTLMRKAFDLARSAMDNG